MNKAKNGDIGLITLKLWSIKYSSLLQFLTFHNILRTWPALDFGWICERWILARVGFGAKLRQTPNFVCYGCTVFFITTFPNNGMKECF